MSSNWYQADQHRAVARDLERELWEHFVERGPHVPALRDLGAVGLRRVSLLNLAEHIIRLWGAAAQAKEACQPLGLRLVGRRSKFSQFCNYCIYKPAKRMHVLLTSYPLDGKHH